MNTMSAISRRALKHADKMRVLFRLWRRGTGEQAGGERQFHRHPYFILQLTQMVPVDLILDALDRLKSRGMYGEGGSRTGFGTRKLRA